MMIFQLLILRHYRAMWYIKLCFLGFACSDSVLDTNTNWATLSLGDISTEGFESKADDLAL
jgi:hypothetical protein